MLCCGSNVCVAVVLVTMEVEVFGSVRQNIGSGAAEKSCLDEMGGWVVDMDTFGGISTVIEGDGILVLADDVIIVI